MFSLNHVCSPLASQLTLPQYSLLISYSAKMFTLEDTNTDID